MEEDGDRAAKRLKQEDADIVDQVVSKGYAIHYLPDKNGNCRTLLTLDIGDALSGNNLQLEENREVVLALVKSNGYSIFLASEALQNDREIVLTAVKQNGEALEHVSDDLRNDREIVMAAVQQDGRALHDASENLRNDREIVLAAVKQKGWALRYASEDLQNDREIVLAAVKQYGSVLGDTPGALKNDREIVMAALQQDGRALQYAHIKFRNSFRFVTLAVSCKERPCENWTHESMGGRKLKKCVKILLKRLKKCGMDTECFASFNDTDVVSHYAEQWKRNLCERVWLVLDQNPAVTKLSPLPGGVRRLVLNYAYADGEYRMASIFHRIAPLFFADAQLEHPRIVEGDLL